MADPGFEERFFRRQRAEILERLDEGSRAAGAHRRRAGARRALPLAAALLLVALLAGVVAVRGPGPAPGPDAADLDGDWLFAWDLPPEMDGVAPLDAFGPDAADAAGIADLADAAGMADAAEAVGLDPAAALDAVLPPLELDEEDNG